MLVGLPGAGKTVVGRRLAQLVGLPFLDFDEEIVKREGKTIPAIFASDGEGYFRRKERELTEEVAGTGAMVLSPGGGWIMQPGLVELVRPPSLLVHLAVSPEVAVDRIRRQPGTRPLLTGADPLLRLHALWRERRGQYERADLVVDTEGITEEEVSSQIAALIVRSGTKGAGPG